MKIMYTPVNPLFYYIKVGCKLHGLVILFFNIILLQECVLIKLGDNYSKFSFGEVYRQIFGQKNEFYGDALTY